MRTFTLWSGLLILGAWVGHPVAQANDFSDTTTGRIEEDTKSNGLSSDKALTKRGQNIMKRFKEGRFSSAKKLDSRFSGNLEMHDANQDGVVDHKVDPDNTNLEGRMASLLPAGKDLEERARKSREAANKGSCGDAFGGRDKNGKTSCFSPSGIIVDTGDAHDGKDSRHRKLRLSKDAEELAGEVGKTYGKATIKDIETAMKEEYGLKNEKVAAIDHLKSESAWLHEQKTNNLDRSWKTLRAARLAGMDEADETASGTSGESFMHEVDLMISQGGKEAEVAEKIALNSSVQREVFVKDANGAWKPYDQNDKDQQNTIAKARADGKLDDIQKQFSGLDRADKDALHQTAFDAAKNRMTQDPAVKKQHEENVAKIQGCMDKDVWCHNQDTADEANSQAASQGGASSQTNTVKAFEAVSGDPGAVFQDTRELVALKHFEAQNAPIDEIENIVTNHDFNRNTDPEYYKDLDKLKKEAADLQKTNAARGNDAHDTKTQSVQAFFGIKEGVNDSYREEGTEDMSVYGDATTGGRGPAPASTPPTAPRAPDYKGGTAARSGGIN